MKMRFLWLLAIPGIAFAGKTWGPPPTDHVAQIDAFYKAGLKDPDSVKVYAVSDLFQCKDRTKWGARVWCACTKISAKNSYGAYSGTSVDAFLFDAKTGQIYSQYEAWRLSKDKECAVATFHDRDPAVLATPPRP